jgi:hypothetical protein
MLRTASSTFYPSRRTPSTTSSEILVARRSVPRGDQGETPKYGKDDTNNPCTKANANPVAGRSQGPHAAAAGVRGQHMSDIYNADILEWFEGQAALLRRLAAGERVNDADLDWPNIA